MSDLNDLIARNAVMAYNEGLERGASMEMDRIVGLLESRVTRLDAMRPEGYKRVADLANVRIVTYRNIIKLIKGDTDGQDG